MTDKYKNYIQAKEMEQENKELIKALCPRAQDRSGIYLFWREDADGIRYAYVGKSVKVLTRLAAHLNGYEQYIDKSIRKHGLASVDNPFGYRIEVLTYCAIVQLDNIERAYVKHYANMGYQLRNVESGGTSGKTDINERKPARGYRDGVAQGERNIIKQIKHLFDLHLKAVYKADKPSKNAEKAMTKFKEMIQGE